MSQSCFSLEFLSQNSLWKLSTICGYKRYLYWCLFAMQRFSFSHNRVVWWLGLATGLSREFKSRANYLASMRLLSCSATASVTLQLPYMLYTCASFGDLLTVSHLWDPIASPCRMHTSELFFTLSHTLPLHDSHLNTGFLNAELQANLAQNKANKMVD